VELTPVGTSGKLLMAPEEMRETLDGGTTEDQVVPGERLLRRLAACMPQALVDRRARLDAEKRTYRITNAAGGVLSMTVLGGTLRADAPAHDFTEVTLTLEKGALAALNRLARSLIGRLNMTPIEGDLLSRRLAPAGIALPQHVESDELTIHLHDRFVDAAYRVLRRQLDRMVWNEPGSRLGLDPESLHDMRVATRRMRAALRVFGEALPPTRVKSLARGLKWLGQTLGAVRDLDVYILHLREELADVVDELQPALALYRDHLYRQRERARRHLLRTLNTDRYQRFVERFDAFLAAGPARNPSAPRAADPVAAVARDIITQRMERLLTDARELSPQAPDAQLHKLRIRCKRLRYACEFFVDLYGKRATRFIERLVGLQDALGDNQDAVVANATLAHASQAISAPAARKRELHMAMGHLMALHAQRGRAARANFFKRWKSFDRKKIIRPLLSRVDKLA
jgi:CHAD domain-containing protein